MTERKRDHRGYLLCPHCGLVGDALVSDSRGRADGMAVVRRRQCQLCGGRFTTTETIGRPTNMPLGKLVRQLRHIANAIERRVQP